MSGHIIIYQDPSFKGSSRVVTEDVSKLQSIGFNERVSSIKVVGSVWVGYEHNDYGGRQYILEEGEYANAGAWKGCILPNAFRNLLAPLAAHRSGNQLSSLKKLNLDMGETPQITVYQHENYRGKALNFNYEMSNLAYYDFNDTLSSIKVKSGIWILYEHSYFKGKQYIVAEGTYPKASAYTRRLSGDNEISSLRPIKEPANCPTEVLRFEYDIAAGLIWSTPIALVNLSQRNNSSSDQKASWSTTRAVTTTKAYEWHWENSLAISVATEIKTGVPYIAEGKISMGVENTFSVGQNRGEENTQLDEWDCTVPATVKAQTRLRAQVNIQQGKIEVPFTAVLKKGNRVWEEIGTYKGTQSYNMQVDYNESPLEVKE